MTFKQTRLLVLGANGLLGNAVTRWFSAQPEFEVVGTVRSLATTAGLFDGLSVRLVAGIEAESPDCLSRLFSDVDPDLVINCIGVVKQQTSADDPLIAIPVNSLLPHRLARLCEISSARLIHISTDCVFSGRKGAYVEDDVPDACDLYSRSKLLGEVDRPNTVTLRTSIIGHKRGTAQGLVDWFLAQPGHVRGFAKAVFSGLPTVELARVIQEFVLPRPELQGIYHLSVDPISKHDLLQLVARVYGRSNLIVSDSNLVIDRSLDSSRFRKATGYQPPSWDALVQRMHEFG